MSLIKILIPVFWIFLSSAQGHSKLESLKVEGKGSGRRFALSFSSPVELAFSRFILESKRLQNPLSLVPLTSKKIGAEFILLAPGLDPGLYVLRWTILSADGHRQEGRQQIRVN